MSKNRILKIILLIICVVCLGTIGISLYAGSFSFKNVVEGKEESARNQVNQPKETTVSEAKEKGKKPSKNKTAEATTQSETKESKLAKESQSEAESQSAEESTKEETAQQSEAAPRKDPITIVLDPGHGGEDSGACGDASDAVESRVNLLIGQYLKEELEQYEGVRVYLTREDNSSVELENRIQYAVDHEADVMISLHNNAMGPITGYTNGCTVLIPKGTFDAERGLESQELACCVLQELENLGIENQGLLVRNCQNGQTYPTGDKEDYYFIIRNTQYAHMTGILIEHCFIDDELDYEEFLSSKDKIKELAKADADGIAAYYHLVKNGVVHDGVSGPYCAEITEISTDDMLDNLYYTKTYFE